MTTLALLLVLALAVPTPARAQSFDEVFSFDFVWNSIAAFFQFSPDGTTVERDGDTGGQGTAEVRRGADGSLQVSFDGEGGTGSFQTVPATTAPDGTQVAAIPGEFGTVAQFPLPPGVFDGPIDQPDFAVGSVTLGPDGSTLSVEFDQGAHSNTFGQNYEIRFTGNGTRVLLAAEPEVLSVLLVGAALLAVGRAIRRRQAPAPR